MANDAANVQLPIMLRKPKMVWPGLDKEGLHLKSIAGDGRCFMFSVHIKHRLTDGKGNCLFASLSDQLYGTPSRHGEIRSTIIEHMRAFRPLYEDFVHTDDVIQRRATRSTTESIRKNAEDDAFEGYLSAMSRPGTYGGQPELLAFVRAYDQDVTVHLPPSGTWNTSTMPYRNEHRDIEADVKPPLHICYGGDEEKNAHYDSSQKSVQDMQQTILTTRSKSQSQADEQAAIASHGLTPRAMRNMKSDPNKDMMHELVTRGSKEVRNSLDLLNDRRARSPSVASSHYSTSSKRSYEDEGDQPRASKRADRKKRSLRSRAAVRQLSGSPKLSIPATNSQPTSSGPPTPTSSQDTDSSSDRVDGGGHANVEGSVSASDVIDLEDDFDREIHARLQRPKIILRNKPSASVERDIDAQISILVSDQPRQALRT